MTERFKTLLPEEIYTDLMNRLAEADALLDAGHRPEASARFSSVERDLDGLLVRGRINVVERLMEVWRRLQ